MNSGFTRLCSAILLLLFLTPGSHTQSLRPRFDHIAVKDGLSQDIVTSIVQDGRGFMWFGTEDGLNRYDGYSIRVFKFNPRDTTSLSNNVIHTLFVDSRARLWVGTGDGLDLFDEAGDRFVRFKHDPSVAGSISHASVSAIQEDSRGNLWIGTGDGLNRYNEQARAFERFVHDPLSPSSLPSNGINDILLDRSGVLWIATGNGFCRHDSSGVFRTFLGSHAHDGANVQRLFEDRSGVLWAAVENKGLWRLDRSRSLPVRLPIRQTPNIPAVSRTPAEVVVAALEEDSRGNLWIGHFGGLDIHEPRTGLFSHFPANPALPTRPGGRVLAVYRDRAGTMWLGTYQSGVYRYDPRRQKFALLQVDPATPNGLGSNYVTSVLEDRDGIVWIGTDRGLDRYNRRLGSFTHFRHNPKDPRSIGSDQINAILEDSRGNLWIGGSGRSASNLDRYDRQSRQFIHYAATGVRALKESRDGTLWIGLLDEANTGMNLAKLDPRSRALVRYSVPGTGVWNIFEDRRGNLWLGGQYCCFNKRDGSTGNFVNIETVPADTTKLNSGAVRSMVEDSAGNLWLGTWGGGLLHYDPVTDKVQRILESDGLPSNYVKGILADHKGELWIATERGLSRFDPARRTFRNYTTEDGLQGDRFLSGSCCKGTGGWMYFGGVNGLNLFHPDSIEDNAAAPPVVITNFRVFDTPLTAAVFSPEEIRLSHDQDFFSFDFVALDFAFPQKNAYSYILEGYDHDWVQAGTRRYAAYTGVHPGSYVFRVRGANSDGVWNMEGASLHITVEPPYWETWWFITLTAAAAIALLVFAYLYRVNQLLAVERLRARIASDLHDDIGTNLSTIALASQSLARARGLNREGLDLVERIRTVALRTTDQMKDIVWVLKTTNDSLDHVVARMADVARQLLGGIHLHFEAPAVGLLEKVSLEFKRNIFLFFKECLNNVVKHSGANRVTIRAEQAGDAFILLIEDNGKGFVEKRRSSGSGLENLRARAGQLGGSLEISSRPGKGTRIVLTVKMTQMRHRFGRQGMLS